MIQSRRQQLPLPDKPLNQQSRGFPQAGVMILFQRGQSLAGRSSRHRRRRFGQIVKTAAVMHQFQQVQVGTAKGRRAQGRRNSYLIGRVVNSPQAVQQVLHFLSVKNQGRTLQPIGNVGFLQGLLQIPQGSAAGHQDAHIRIAGGPVLFPGRFGIPHLPLFRREAGQQGGDGLRSFLAGNADRSGKGLAQPLDARLAGQFRRPVPAGEQVHIFGLPRAAFAHPRVKKPVDPRDNRPLGAEVLGQLQTFPAHPLP